MKTIQCIQRRVGEGEATVKDTRLLRYVDGEKGVGKESRLLSFTGNEELLPGSERQIRCAPQVDQLGSTQDMTASSPLKKLTVPCASTHIPEKGV